MIIRLGEQMTAADMPVPARSTGNTGRAIAVYARSVAERAVVAAHRGVGTLVGAVGLASISVGAGMIYLPAGFIVGGVLTTWFASRLGGADA